MRLIDADALSVDKMIVGQNPVNGHYDYVSAVLVSEINKAPTIEVIKCKDCKWWCDGTSPLGDHGYGVCEKWLKYVGGMYFCADAEKRDIE